MEGRIKRLEDRVGGLERTMDKLSSELGTLIREIAQRDQDNKDRAMAEHAENVRKLNRLDTWVRWGLGLIVTLLASRAVEVAFFHIR